MPEETPDRGLVASLVLGAVLNPVNSSIIAVSLVPIGAALDAVPAETAWLVSGLYLTTAIGQPVVGRLVDLHGPRRLYLLGAVLVAVGGALGTVAPSLPVLVAARVVIGLGTCAGYPAAMSLVRGRSGGAVGDRPPGMLTALAVAAQTSAVLGPPLGGLLVGLGGWRATFAVNVPLALACLVLGRLFLPRRPVPDPSGAAVPAAGRLDLAGIGLFSAALVTCLLFLLELDPGLWWLAVASVGCAAGLVLWELRAASPFLDLRLLAGNRPLLATYARALVAQGTAYVYFFGYTQWLQDGRGLSAAQAGLLLAPMFGAAVVVSALAGRRGGLRGKLVVGALGQAAVAGLMLSLGPTGSTWSLAVVSVAAALPLGLIGLANQHAVHVQADPGRIGSSAGLLRTSSYSGAILASAVTGLAYPVRADTAGMHLLALVMLGASVLLLALTLADRSLRRGRRR